MDAAGEEMIVQIGCVCCGSPWQDRGLTQGHACDCVMFKWCPNCLKCEKHCKGRNGCAAEK